MIFFFREPDIMFAAVKKGLCIQRESMRLRKSRFIHRRKITPGFTETVAIPLPVLEIYIEYFLTVAPPIIYKKKLSRILGQAFLT